MNLASIPSTSKAWPKLFLASAILIWYGLYKSLIPLSEWLVSLLPIERQSHLGDALQFFLYDTPKVLLLLTGVVFVMGMINSYFTPERTRVLLAGKSEGVGNIMAASLGIVTPFCSCSAVPLFIGFVQAGVPLGITFSFLISAPMVNEVALTLLFSMFGWKVASLYLVLGLSVAIISGWIIGKLKLEHWVQDWVYATRFGQTNTVETTLNINERVDYAFTTVKDIVGKVWIYVAIGIAVGAGAHGYVPEEYMASLMGKSVWYSVPLSVLIGIPLYSNAAGIIPIVSVLLEKGASLGTALAFMMSVIALSLPEIIILKKV
jgi:uncharacterized membrane protein YraQ (UPF0718 family)